MKVPISNMTFGESEYHRGNEVWKASTLYLFAKAKEYPILDLPLWCIDLTAQAFESTTLSQFIFSANGYRIVLLITRLFLMIVGRLQTGITGYAKQLLKDMRL